MLGCREFEPLNNRLFPVEQFLASAHCSYKLKKRWEDRAVAVRASMADVHHKCCNKVWYAGNKENQQCTNSLA